MRLLPEKNPAVASGRVEQASKNHVALIAQNSNPRERWRARVPFRRIKISDELRAFLAAMGATHGE